MKTLILVFFVSGLLTFVIQVWRAINEHNRWVDEREAAR